MTLATILSKRQGLESAIAEATTAFEHAASLAQTDPDAKGLRDFRKKELEELRQQLQEVLAAERGQTRSDAQDEARRDLAARKEGLAEYVDAGAQLVRIASEIQRALTQVDALLHEAGSQARRLQLALRPGGDGTERSRGLAHGATVSIDDIDLKAVLAGIGLGRFVDEPLQHERALGQRIEAKVERALPRARTLLGLER